MRTSNVIFNFVFDVLLLLKIRDNESLSQHFTHIESKSVNYKSKWLVSVWKRLWFWMGLKLGKTLFYFLVNPIKYPIIRAKIICSKWTIKTLEEGLKICSKIIVKTHSFEHILRLLLVFLLLTLIMHLFAGMDQLSQLCWKLTFLIWIQILLELLLMALLITVPTIQDLTKATIAKDQ